MDKALAEREIAAHERAARRTPRKAEQHRLAARLLREQHGIPEPAPPLVNEFTQRNAQARKAEVERIKLWKESR